jgi:hypothetical protein
MSKQPMDDDARDLLETFAKTSNLSTGIGGLHALDWTKFHEFIVYVHMRALPINEQDVTTMLYGNRVTDETAVALGARFEEAIRLLRVYDQLRGA